MPSSPQQTLAATPFSKRDDRLDFWRALCLIDMVLVHLVYAGVNFGHIQRIVGEYTRFAAGGFVFVAGLSIGAIFLPRTFKSGGQKKVYLALWRRSLYILCVHFAATLSFVSLDLITGLRTDVPGVFHLIRDILLFREGGDLLPLYVIMVAASPAMLELLRRRMGWVIAIVSVALFAYGQNHPWFLSSPIHDKFPVILWQMIFAAGMLFGAVLPRYSILRPSIKLTLALTAAAISLFLWAGDFRSEMGWTHPVLPLSFVKTPLSIGEMLRYFGIIFTIIFATDLLWPRIAALRVTSFINTLGRRSLAVYVGHVWIFNLLMLLSWKIAGAGAWQMLLAIPAVIGMWLIAQTLEWQDSRKVVKAVSWRARWLPIPLGSLASIFALLIAARFVSVPAPAPSNQMPQYTGSLDGFHTPDDPDTSNVPTLDQPDSTDIMSA